MKTALVVAGGEPQVRIFPGKVEAARKAELAFQVPGLIVKLPVREGDKVKKGDLIAQLREDEFKARLKTLQGQLDAARAVLQGMLVGERPEQLLRLDAQVRAAAAKLANARAEAERATTLFRSRAVSREEFDRAQTVHRLAQEELASAQQLREKGTVAREEDLAAQKAQVRSLEGQVVEANLRVQDCTLRAPFDGVIAQRFVEENQNVQAKQPVVKFQDAEEIEVVIDVPETVMVADLRSADVLEMAAEFSGAPGVQFPIRLTEIAQRADPTTQTFAVRGALKTTPDLNLLPGMTATVATTFRRASILDQRILVPLAAVSKTPAGQQVAWVVGPDSKVASRPVKLGDPQGRQVEILEGLAPGDRIAVAGASFLRDGMAVRDLGDGLGAGQP